MPCPRERELKVTSRLLKQNGKVEIVLRDTGSGIPREQIDKVFKPFYTTKPKGMGVGLSLAKRIIERHGGTLRLGSEEGIGTAVSLRIPAAG